MQSLLNNIEIIANALPKIIQLLQEGKGNNCQQLSSQLAPPEKAAEILKGMGYQVSAKLLRQKHSAGDIPGVWVGSKRLINLAGALDYLQKGDGGQQQNENL